MKFEAEVAKRAKGTFPKPLGGPLRVTVRCILQRAKSNKTLAHTQRPDVDNLAKSVLDALNGVAYIDDAQIVCLTASKEWSTAEDQIVVYVEELAT